MLICYDLSILKSLAAIYSGNQVDTKAHTQSNRSLYNKYIIVHHIQTMKPIYNTKHVRHDISICELQSAE